MRVSSNSFRIIVIIVVVVVVVDVLAAFEVVIVIVIVVVVVLFPLEKYNNDWRTRHFVAAVEEACSEFHQTSV